MGGSLNMLVSIVDLVYKGRQIYYVRQEAGKAKGADLNALLLVTTPCF